MDNLNSVPNAGNWGDAASKLNDNFNKIKQAVTTVENVSKNNKGYFPSLSALNTAFPNPKAGNIAYVFDEDASTRYYIYNSVNGAWTASTVEAPAVGVDILGYTKTGGSPKTLKEVDDDLVRIEGDLKENEYVAKTGSKILYGYRFDLKGNLLKDSNFYITPYIEVDAVTELTLFNGASGTVKGFGVQYNRSLEYVDYISMTDAPRNVYTDSQASFIRLNILIGNTEESFVQYNRSKQFLWKGDGSDILTQINFRIHDKDNIFDNISLQKMISERSLITDTYIAEGGAILTKENWGISSKIDISDKTNIIWYNGNDSDFTVPSLTLFTELGAIITGFTAWQKLRELEIPENASYFIASFYLPNIKECYVRDNEGNTLWDIYSTEKEYLHEAISRKESTIDSDLKIRNLTSYIINETSNIIIGSRLRSYGEVKRTNDCYITPFLDVSKYKSISFLTGVDSPNTMFIVTYDEGKNYVYDYGLYPAMYETGRGFPRDKTVKYVRMGVYIPTMDNAYIKGDDTTIWKGDTQNVINQIDSYSKESSSEVIEKGYFTFNRVLDYKGNLQYSEDWGVTSLINIENNDRFMWNSGDTAGTSPITPFLIFYDEYGKPMAGSGWGLYNLKDREILSKWEGAKYLRASMQSKYLDSCFITDVNTNELLWAKEIAPRESLELAINKLYNKESLLEEDDIVLFNKNKEEYVITACRNRKDTKDFQALLLTDTHGNDESINNGVQLSNYFDTIDTVIHLGDFTTQTFYPYSQTEKVVDLLNESNKPWLLVAGNHDVGQTKSIYFAATHEDAWNSFTVPMIEAGVLKEGEYVQDKPWYYKDFKDTETRVIVPYDFQEPLVFDDTNEYWEAVPYDESYESMTHGTSYIFDPENDTILNCANYKGFSFKLKKDCTTTTNHYQNEETMPMYKSTRDSRVIMQDQAEWFISTLNTTPDGYGVVIATHIVGMVNVVNRTDKRFAFPTEGGFGGQWRMKNDFYSVLINAWMNKEVITEKIILTSSESYQNVEDDGDGVKYAYKVTGDFSGRNNDTYFGGYLSGHMHTDHVYQHNIYKQQWGIASPTTNGSIYTDFGYTDKGYLANGTFNVFSCAKNRIAMVRLGNTAKEDGRKRDYEVINTDTD